MDLIIPKYYRNVITLPCLGVVLFPPYVTLHPPLEFSAELFSSSVTQSPCIKNGRQKILTEN